MANNNISSSPSNAPKQDIYVSDADVQKYIQWIWVKSQKDILLTELNSKIITIPNTTWWLSVGLPELIRSINPTVNEKNDLNVNIRGETYTIPSWDNLIKLIQCYIYIFWWTVQFKNWLPAKDQIDGKNGKETSKAIIALQTQLTLRIVISWIGIGAELETLKTNLSSISRASIRKNTLEYNEREGKLKIQSYGNKSVFDINSGKIFFQFNGKNIEVPVDTKLDRNDTQWKINEILESNKENIKQLIQIVNTLHLIVKDFIVNDTKALTNRPFSVWTDINKLLKKYNKTFTFNDSHIIDTTILKKQFIDADWWENLINYDEFVKFLNNLYIETHPAQQQKVSTSTTTITSNISNNPQPVKITKKP